MAIKFYIDCVLPQSLSLPLSPSSLRLASSLNDEAFNIQSPSSPPSYIIQYLEQLISKIPISFFFKEYMEFLTAPPSSSSSSSSNVVGPNGGRDRNREGSSASQLAEKLICAIVTCVFATVGLFVGAITGALLGLATESGLFRGAGIGAISGAVFSIEAVESSVALWHSNDSGIWSVLYVIDIFASLLSGRLVREKVGPAVQSAVQSQMSAVDAPFIEVLDIFETGGTDGMSKDSVNKIEKIEISMENNVDSSGEKMCCLVCLQDFQTGETARCLPHCRHMFHLQCIDRWLIRHGSCPLCRRDI